MAADSQPEAGFTGVTAPPPYATRAVQQAGTNTAAPAPLAAGTNVRSAALRTTIVRMPASMGGCCREIYAPCAAFL